MDPHDTGSLSEWRHRIPPRIIQFWHDLGCATAWIRDAMDHTVATHPGLEYLFADDAHMVEFIQRHYGSDVRALYESNTVPASRSDIARLMLLVEYGGFYLDAAQKVRAPLHTAVPPNTELLLAHWATGPVNGVIAAVPNHEVIRSTLERALFHLKHGYHNREVLVATGPDCLQATLDSLGEPPNTCRRGFYDLIVSRGRDPERPDPYVGTWREQERLGIRRLTETDRHDPCPPGADEAQIAAAIRDDMYFLEGLPPRRPQTAAATIDPRVTRAVNVCLTGREETSWAEDLAARGFFRHVALLTTDSPPIDFLRAAEIERLTVISPRRRMLPMLEEWLGECFPELSVDTLHCNLNDPSLPEAAFDLVLAFLCVNRVVRLERLFESIARSLWPGGRFCFVDYIGNDRLQFSAHQLALAQALLDELVGAEEDGVRTRVSSPWLLADKGPLVAVRSSQIVPTARAVFDEEHHATCGAALLPIFFMAPNCLLEGFPTVIEYEHRLRSAGEEGLVAYCVYSKR